MDGTSKSGPVRAAAALALMGFLALGSCDLAGDEGGPGSSPGLVGSISSAPSPNLSLSTLLASKALIEQPNSSSFVPSISADGQFVAFVSNASNLVPNDTNGVQDVFVRDTVTGTTTRVSVNSLGNQATGGGSYDPYISGNGQFVVFTSQATNLAAGDADGIPDVYLHDRNSGATELISVSTAAVKGNSTSERPSVSDNGQWVAFHSFAANLSAGDGNGTADVFVRDRTAVTTTRVSVDTIGNSPNSLSWYPSISANGDFVIFQSYANNILPAGFDTNGSPDIYRAPRTGGAGSAIRVSVGAGGVQGFSSSYCTYFNGGGACISSTGDIVVFSSFSNNLVSGDFNGQWDVFVRNITLDTTVRVSVGTGGTEGNNFSFDGRITSDGQFAIFHSNATTLGPDGNTIQDAFVRDLVNDTTTLVSTASDGSIANSSSASPMISADGTKVVFSSNASNLIADDLNFSQDIFMKDLATGVTQRVSEQSAAGGTDSNNVNPYVASGAPIVVFESDATNLLATPTAGLQIFRRDVLNQTTLVVSLNTGGLPGNGPSFTPVCSSDGRFVAFASDATDLVPGDSLGQTDIFVRDMAAGVTTRVSVDSDGNEADGGSFTPSISSDGRYVAFISGATNLVGSDGNSMFDVFVHDRVPDPVTGLGKTIRVSVDSTGAEGDQDSLSVMISGNGRFVVFDSFATNLVAGDTNGAVPTDGADIFVHDRDSDGDGVFDESGAVTTTRVSVDSAGAQSNGPSFEPTISSDGRFVAFMSFASNLVGGDAAGRTDIFVHDRGDASTTRVSRGLLGAEADFNSSNPFVSGNGRFVAFESFATNLVAGDGNGFLDVFVFDLQSGATSRVSVSTGGGDADSSSNQATLTADGKWVSFTTDATDVILGDGNGFVDVVIRGPLN